MITDSSGIPWNSTLPSASTIERESDLSFKSLPTINWRCWEWNALCRIERLHIRQPHRQLQVFDFRGYGDASDELVEIRLDRVVFPPRLLPGIAGMRDREYGRGSPAAESFSGRAFFEISASADPRPLTTSSRPNRDRTSAAQPWRILQKRATAALWPCPPAARVNPSADMMPQKGRLSKQTYPVLGKTTPGGRAADEHGLSRIGKVKPLL